MEIKGAGDGKPGLPSTVWVYSEGTRKLFVDGVHEIILVYRGYKVIYPPLVFDNSNSFRANHQIFCENQALFENPAI